MDKVIDDGIRVNLRMRFTCTVYRAIAPEEAARADAKGKGRKAIKKPGGEILMSQVDRSGWEALEGSSNQPNPDAPGRKDKEIMCFSTRPVEQFEVLNDLVVDRGPSPFVSLLELFGEYPLARSTDARGRASSHHGAGRRLDSVDPHRLDRLLAVRRRVAGPPSDPSHPHHAHLPAHTILPTDAPARQHGAADLRAVQLAQHGVGEFRRSRPRRAEA